MTSENITKSHSDDEKFMRMALNEAERALAKQEVPIGAVVVAGGRVIGRGHNLVETLMDATAHAEMQAITAAMSTLGGKYLNECTLYVTVEPCVMCGGALAWSQIGRVVYGTPDAKRGYVIIHKCERCGGISRNKAAHEAKVQPDDMNLIIKLTAGAL